MKVGFIYSVLVMVAVSYGSAAQSPSADSILPPEDRSLYLFCRATKNKLSLACARYNIIDSNITHVAIGFTSKGRIIIYNVTDDPQAKNAFRLETINSFLAVPAIYRFAVWKFIQPVCSPRKLKRHCDKYFKYPVRFDSKLDLCNGDTKLYCSEFVANTLNRCLPRLFNYQPTQAPLTGRFEQLYLGKTSLCYYPPDFFLSDQRFVLVLDVALPSTSVTVKPQ